MQAPPSGAPRRTSQERPGANEQPNTQRYALTRTKNERTRARAKTQGRKNKGKEHPKSERTRARARTTTTPVGPTPKGETGGDGKRKARVAARRPGGILEILKCTGHFGAIPLVLFISLSLSLSPSLAISLSRAISLSFSFPLSLSLALYLSISLFDALPLSLPLSLSLSVYLFISFCGSRQSLPTGRVSEVQGERGEVPEGSLSLSLCALTDPQGY